VQNLRKTGFGSKKQQTWNLYEFAVYMMCRGALKCLHTYIIIIIISAGCVCGIKCRQADIEKDEKVKQPGKDQKISAAVCLRVGRPTNPNDCCLD